MTPRFIQYSVHSRERMRERKVSEGQVERTINYPDSVKMQPNGRRCAERRTDSGNRLRVVYEERLGPDIGRHVVVVTVIRG